MVQKPQLHWKVSLEEFLAWVPSAGRQGSAGSWSVCLRPVLLASPHALSDLDFCWSDRWQTASWGTLISISLILSKVELIFLGSKGIRVSFSLNPLFIAKCLHFLCLPGKWWSFNNTPCGQIQPKTCNLLSLLYANCIINLHGHLGSQAGSTLPLWAWAPSVPSLLPCKMGGKGLAFS